MFACKSADPTLEFIKQLIAMKHDAHERARRNVERVRTARAAMHPDLFEELMEGYQTLADTILLARDWNSYILMQYAIERKLVPADRPMLARMSRYAEQFIRNLLRLRDTEAGRFVEKLMAFPDPFQV